MPKNYISRAQGGAQDIMIIVVKLALGELLYYIGEHEEKVPRSRLFPSSELLQMPKQVRQEGSASTEKNIFLKILF